MLIKLKVHSAAKESALKKKAADSYEVWVRARAERGLANEEALGALSRALWIAAARLHIVKGATSPSKVVRVFERRPD